MKGDTKQVFFFKKRLNKIKKILLNCYVSFLSCFFFLPFFFKIGYLFNVSIWGILISASKSCFPIANFKYREISQFF